MNEFNIDQIIKTPAPMSLYLRTKAEVDTDCAITVLSTFRNRIQVRGQVEKEVACMIFKKGNDEEKHLMCMNVLNHVGQLMLAKLVVGRTYFMVGMQLGELRWFDFIEQVR